MSIVDELQKLQELRAAGALTQQEFENAKAAVLTSGPPSEPAGGPPSSATTEPESSGTVANVKVVEVATAADEDGAGGASFLDPGANLRAGIRALLVLSFLGCLCGGGGYAYLWYFAGSDVADRTAATLVKAPIDLTDQTVTVRSSSWYAVPISPTYTGEVEIRATVVSGNPLRIIVLREAELAKFKADQPYRDFPDFRANGASSYVRSAQLTSGVYYVVLIDETLGILSSSTTDVRVAAKLRP